MNAHVVQFHNRQEMLMRLVTPGSAILEIGVFRGTFAKFLRSLSPRELHLVDPFSGVLCSGNADGVYVQGINGDDAFDEVVAMFQYDKVVQIHRDWSPAALLLFPDEHFDVIYIDGDHTYEGVRDDLSEAFKKTKDGGLLCGHDYEVNPSKCPFPYAFGVRRAVDEFCTSHNQTIAALGNDGYVSYAIRVNKSKNTDL